MVDPYEQLSNFEPLRVGDPEGETGRRYLLLDVFTDTPLSGNQLAVFPDGRAFTDAGMQRIARELNLSETVFLLPANGKGDALARIFTPRVELPFAGHPVLGSGIVVAWALEREEIELLTHRGPVPLKISRGESWTAFARMEQPIPSWEPYLAADELLAAVGVRSSLLPIDIYRNGPQHAFIELDDEGAVASLSPNSAALEMLGDIGVSCFAGRGQRWKTRMFAPGIGVPEDSATGSAAGPLALHLARHGRIAFGEEIEIHQGEELHRNSVLFARAVGSNAAIERIEVAGSVVLVGTGTLRG